MNDARSQGLSTTAGLSPASTLGDSAPTTISLVVSEGAFPQATSCSLLGVSPAQGQSELSLGGPRRPTLSSKLCPEEEALFPLHRFRGRGGMWASESGETTHKAHVNLPLATFSNPSVCVGGGVGMWHPKDQPPRNQPGWM